jgi:hypothetical protein
MKYGESRPGVTIQGLWIGSKLSALEQLSISSFLANGHSYHLYVYDEPAGVPSGTILRDGNKILPASMIFQYRDHKSYSAFSNYFRYKLLLERGGWWCDTDVICLRPFDFEDRYVFATEPVLGGETITSGVMKSPRGSDAMSYAWRVCGEKDRATLVWGEVGPRLVRDAVERFSLQRFVKPRTAFCPISYTEWESVLDGSARFEFGEETFALHLWNEMWRREKRDKDGMYDSRCLFERLKMRYLPRRRTSAP